MRFIDTGFPGLIIVEPTVFKDARGFFLESWNRRGFEEHGLKANFVQDNHARSEARGVLRGFHFQLPPATQAKLVRVSRGSVFDVVLDLRRGSPTYGRTYSLVLSADNFRQLYIPKGFAHAYQCLDEGTEFQYKVDAYYAPSLDSGIIWNDLDLAVDWPIEDPILSSKDELLPRLRDFESPFIFEE